MNCRRRLFVCILAVAALPYPASAGEKNESLAGLRMECDTCHGINGVSVVPDQTPSLAGKSERYLLRQLLAFKSGKRKHEAMLLMGSKLTEQELKQLAQYYSRIQP